MGWVLLELARTKLWSELQARLWLREFLPRMTPPHTHLCFSHVYTLVPLRPRRAFHTVWRLRLSDACGLWRGAQLLASRTWPGRSEKDKQAATDGGSQEAVEAAEELVVGVVQWTGPIDER